MTEFLAGLMMAGLTLIGFLIHMVMHQKSPEFKGFEKYLTDQWVNKKGDQIIWLAADKKWLLINRLKNNRLYFYNDKTLIHYLKNHNDYE